MYSIVDIEATGGNSRIGKITEIAIYNYNGFEITDSYSSLVNPERSIPIYVQRLTGINDQMTAEAPTFEKVASAVLKMLDGNCLVAHNVKADYTFIKAEMEKIGIAYASERLCTLELSKKLIPNADSHGLSKICKHLGIELADRHRASGDAKATVDLFRHLQLIDSENYIQRFKRKA